MVLCVSGTTAGEGRRVFQFLSALQLSANQGAQRHPRDSLRVREVLQVGFRILLLMYFRSRETSAGYFAASTGKEKTKPDASSYIARYL